MQAGRNPVAPPLPGVVLILPLNPELPAGPHRVATLREAFEAFRPEIACQGEGGFAVRRPLRHIRDLDPVRWSEGQAEADDGLASLTRLWKTFEDLVKRWRLAAVRGAWQEAAHRPGIVEQLMTFDPMPQGGGRQSVLDEIFPGTSEAAPAGLLALASLRPLVDPAASHEEIEARLRGRMEEIEAARQRLVQAALQATQPLARAWAQLAVFFENLLPLPAEIWPAVHVLNAAAEELSETELSSLERFVLDACGRPRFQQTVGQIVAPGRMEEASAARLERLASRAHLLLITDWKEGEEAPAGGNRLTAAGKLVLPACAAPVSSATALAASLLSAEISGAGGLRPVAGSGGHLAAKGMPEEGAVAALATDSAGRPAFRGPFLCFGSEGIGRWYNTSRYFEYLDGKCRQYRTPSEDLQRTLIEQRASGWLRDFGIAKDGDQVRVELTPALQADESWTIEFPALKTTERIEPAPPK